ncbi:MAG: hypothetical protein ACU83O_06100 [Gammaproteobacteria bacterium]
MCRNGDSQAPYPHLLALHGTGMWNGTSLSVTDILTTPVINYCGFISYPHFGDVNQSNRRIQTVVS